MLHEEVEKYINLSGDKKAWQNTSVSRIGGYLDGYDKGIEVLDKIRAEIESYKLSEDELSDMDEDSVKWGMKIAYDIVDKYKAETEVEDGNDD